MFSLTKQPIEISISILSSCKGQNDLHVIRSFVLAVATNQEKA